MKTLIILALLVVAASAVPAKKSLAERVEISFNKWLLTEKKEVKYPPGFNDKKCDGADCCASNVCANGICQDENTAPADSVASKYGYICTGPKCGVDITKDQFAGTFCDVPAKDACSICKQKHGKYTFCYPTTVTTMGYICMKKEDKDYIVFNRREFDVLYGEGTASALENIAREEDEAEVPDKKALTDLLKELINELDDKKK